MRAQSNRPIIAITMGDPSGVGPEIILKALTDKELYDICIPVVIGDENIISSVREKVFLNKAPSVNPIKELDQAL